MNDKKSQSQFEIVRETLEKLEYAIARLDECSREETLEIPVLFDRAVSGFEKLEQSGASFSSEKGVFETVSAQFRRKLNVFLNKLDGGDELRQFRQTHNPSQDRWWWYADQIVAAHQRKTTLRWGRNIGIAAIIIFIVIVVYQRFFAPDPAISASVGHQQQAEMLLANLEFEAAYQEVQNALSYTPKQFDLLILKGVLEEILEKTDQSLETYSFAKEQLESHAVFYTQRGVYYLMAGLPERAIADC
jgi:tetratricopeptide (TPR) repeat protein